MERWKSFNSAVTIEPAMFMLFFSLYLLVTGYQELLYQKFCQKSYNVSLCKDPVFVKAHQDLQAKTSSWVMYSNIFSVIPALFTITFLAGYSDKHGISFILRIPFISGLLTAIFTTFCAYYISWPVELLFVSSAITGCAGYYSAPIMAAASYIAQDCRNSPESLGIRLGMMEMSLALGSTVGSLIVGPIIEYAGLVTVFIFICASNVLALIDIVFRVRKPKGGYAREVEQAAFKQKLKDLFSFESARSYFKVLARKREKSLRSHLHWLTFSYVIGYIGLTAVTDVLYIYLTKTYGYSELYYSMMLGAGAFSSALGATGGIYLLSHRWQCESITIGVIGLILGAVCSGFYAYGDYPALLWIATVLRFPVVFLSVCARLYTSRVVEPTEVSSILGYTAILQALATLLGSVIFNGIYPFVLSYWPGLIYCISTVLSLIVVPILTFVQRMDRANGIYL